MFSFRVWKSDKKKSGEDSEALRASSTATVRQYSAEQVGVFKVSTLQSTTTAEMCLIVVMALYRVIWLEYRPSTLRLLVM
jgi:hypothetical protein